MRTELKLLGSALLLLCLPVQAGVYKYVDENGNVVYSDQPRQGAKQFDLPEMTTYDTAVDSEAVLSEPGNGQDKDKFKGYKRFAIESPQNNATIRDNAGNLTVNLALDPPLQEGHTAVFQLGGQQASAESPQYTFNNVDRGSHTVRATVEDEQGKKVAGPVSVTVHLKRYSIQNAPNRPKPAP